MATFIQLGDPGRKETPPPRPREGLGQRRPRAAAVTEFGAALTALAIKQRSAAQWFRTSERNIRRWKSGTRKTPPGVTVIVRLMMAGKVGPADVELAAASISARTNSHSKLGLPAPLIGPEPEPESPTLTTAAAQVLALTANSCRWPLGDPQHPDFCFCGQLVSEPPYCPRHRAQAYLARSLSEARPGFRCSPAAPQRRIWGAALHRDPVRIGASSR